MILRGADADFSAGNDMQDFMKSAALKGQLPAAEGPPFILLKSAAKFSKPLIAAVRGVAIGIGVTILLHADLVYSDNTALFQIPFVSLGLSPEGASSKLLVEQAGYHKELPPRRFGFGLYEEDIMLRNGARHIKEVEETIRSIFTKAKIIVGHALENDIAACS